MKKRNSIKEVWKNDLPASFDKGKAIKILAKRWGITERNAFNRIESRYFEAVREANFIAKNFGICFDSEGNFFFDQKLYEQAEEQQQEAFASSIGLSR